jgi:hypothetical protein
MRTVTPQSPTSTNNCGIFTGSREVHLGRSITSLYFTHIRTDFEHVKSPHEPRENSCKRCVPWPRFKLPSLRHLDAQSWFYKLESGRRARRTCILHHIFAINIFPSLDYTYASEERIVEEVSLRSMPSPHDRLGSGTLCLTLTFSIFIYIN